METRCQFRDVIPRSANLIERYLAKLAQHLMDALMGLSLFFGKVNVFVTGPALSNELDILAGKG